MNLDLELLLRALGLAFVLEGLMWTLFPEGMRNVMRSAVKLDGASLRQMGLLGMGIGLVVIWLAAA